MWFYLGHWIPTSPISLFIRNAVLLWTLSRVAHNQTNVSALFAIRFDIYFLLNLYLCSLCCFIWSPALMGMLSRLCRIHTLSSGAVRRLSYNSIVLFFVCRSYLVRIILIIIKALVKHRVMLNAYCKFLGLRRCDHRSRRRHSSWHWRNVCSSGTLRTVKSQQSDVTFLHIA